MPYSATALNIMIASPGDVAAERNIIRNTVHEWNSIHSRDRSLILTPVSWETNAFPGVGRPQAVVNKQILEQCDLLIAVFWTRIGTPTGEADSGTIEEIERHLSMGKPAMLYFSNVPVRPDSVDDKQYAALRAFRTEFQKRGLIETYTSLDEFRQKVSRQLAQTVINKFGKYLNESNPLEVVSQIPSSLQLSETGRKLLREVAQDRHGSLMMVGTFGGLIVQTNGKQLSTPGDARIEARWKSAAKELMELDLLAQQGVKGEVFRLTNRGYAVADELGAAANAAG